MVFMVFAEIEETFPVKKKLLPSYIALEIKDMCDTHQWLKIVINAYQYPIIFTSHVP